MQITISHPAQISLPATPAGASRVSGRCAEKQLPLHQPEPRLVAAGQRPISPPLPISSPARVSGLGVSSCFPCNWLHAKTWVFLRRRRRRRPSWPATQLGQPPARQPPQQPGPAKHPGALRTVCVQPHTVGLLAPPLCRQVAPQRRKGRRPALVGQPAVAAKWTNMAGRPVLPARWLPRSIPLAAPRPAPPPATSARGSPSWWRHW